MLVIFIGASSASTNFSEHKFMPQDTCTVNNYMNIAIIDIIGIPYDGSTLAKQGLGGSESAASLMARELQNLGFSVTVFNNCSDTASPGVYDGVTYRLLSDLNHDHVFDVVVSSRTVIPFTDPVDYNRLGDGRALPYLAMNLYDRIVRHAKMRILWMHDTFCLGDNLIEELAVADRITDIFTLSDFHTTYVTNCQHGRRRNYEVLKNKIFMTRNGAVNYYPEVDIAAKDPNLFVYNAAVSKGMAILVKRVWPRVKQYLPNAKLKLLGGFYKFGTNAAPDAQEVEWRAMSSDPANLALDMEFTGVVPQRVVAEALAQASYTIYPAMFPETYGISALESLLYNTPILTCRFGALEEVALDQACYLIDYPVEPNNLFQDINTDAQVDKFVAMTVQAYNNRYLHQQKQYYCNIVKDIASWATVARQWQQHIYRKTGVYLPRAEYQTVSRINKRVHRVYGRRFHNSIELETYRPGIEQPIVVVSTFYNCEQYIARCIRSIATQDYDNYSVYLVNDASTDDTSAVIAETLGQLPKPIRDKFILIENEINIGAVANQVAVFRSLKDPEAVVMILDGDDSLVNDNTIFSYYNGVYDGTTEFTYGSCWSMVDNIPLISQPYPEAVKKARAYRQHHFNWILPYTHLRTFKQRLIRDIPDSNFQDATGEWYRAGGDGSTFYSLIEAADPAQVKCLPDIVYYYNDTSPINDYKVNGAEQNRNAAAISSTPVPQATAVVKVEQPKQMKTILIAIPTARNIEAETFKSIYDLTVPDGYQVTFQYFYGYNVDQVRNLIADWVVKGFDYLFAVDSDMAFAPDTLAKLLAHDRDMVSGLYIQRIPGRHTLEVYEPNDQGGVTHIPYEKIRGQGLVEIASCGFGCVLVKGEVFKAIPYPHFVYHSAINHANTVSEDIDFCNKARARGFKMFADTTILCRHIGSNTFTVE